MTRAALDFHTLADRGWLEIPNYFPKELVDKSFAQARALAQAEEFKLAAIKASKKINQKVRSDFISWIDDWSASEQLKRFQEEIQWLGRSLSEHMRVSLKSFEGHFTHYRPGSFYLKHLDQHLETRHRQFSFVSYLNDCQGGELVLYQRESRNEIERVISPRAGKLVLFLSSVIFHEVKLSESDRYGLTGWFRDDESLFSNFLSLKEPRACM